MRVPANVRTLTALELAQYGDLLKLDLTHYEPSERNLKKLHKAHVLHAPFSTLSFYEKDYQHPDDFKAKDLSLESAFNQIVLQKQGGTCVSLNLLFASLLKTLGYQVYSQTAHIMFGFPEKRSVATHRFSTVELNNQIFLVDVGFGGKPSLRSPLLLMTSENQGKGIYRYQFSKDQDGHFVLNYLDAGKLNPVYSFDLNRTYTEEEYQDSPKEVEEGISGFISHCPLTVVVEKEKRKILFKDRLTTIESHQTKTDEIDPLERSAVMLNQFNLHLNFSKPITILPLDRGATSAPQLN